MTAMQLVVCCGTMSYKLSESLHIQLALNAVVCIEHENVSLAKQRVFALLWHAMTGVAHGHAPHGLQLLST